jgi:hypothetical protein
MSRPPAASELFQSSIEMLLASNACKIDGPAALLAPFFVPNAALSIAHTMPFAVADDAEIDGVAPTRKVVRRKRSPCEASAQRTKTVLQGASQRVPREPGI